MKYDTAYFSYCPVRKDDDDAGTTSASPDAQNGCGTGAHTAREEGVQMSPKTKAIPVRCFAPYLSKQFSLSY